MSSSTDEATATATATATASPPVQQDILTNIENLQALEKELFSKLESSNDTLTDDQRQELIEQINNISDTRIQLYASLGDVNTFYSSNLQSTSTTLNTQTKVIQMVESQLNDYKTRLQNIEDDKWNKLRLVQINYYYSQMYQDHRHFVIWILVAVTLIFIILMLCRYGFLNEFFQNFLIIVVSVFVIIRLGYMWLDMNRRSTQNYDEFDWSFDPSTAPQPDGDASLTDPWANTGVCQGQACCYTDFVWDASLNICIPMSLPSKVSLTDSVPASVDATDTDAYATMAVDTTTPT
jgi:hypothetical protein